MSTMPEPVTIATSIFSGFNTLVKAISLAAHYKEVPKEVKQLHTNIDRAESSINIAKRLLRSKAHYLDPRLMKETHDSIQATNSVLRLVRDSIESCRKDLELHETVSFKNRAAWLLWKNQEFLSQLQTLGNCLDALDRDIVRLEMAHPPIIFVNGSPAPPAYAVGNQDEDKENGFGVRVDGEVDQKPAFPRSPTKRLRSRSNNSSSQVNLKNRIEPEHNSKTLSPRLEDGDEGYESDESSIRSRSRGRPVTGDHSTQETAEDVALFANATIGIDTSGLGLTITQGQLNTRQVKFLQQAADTTASPVRIRHTNNIPELPVAHSEEQDHEIPIPLSYSFSSRNPFRRLAAQSSSSVHTTASCPQDGTSMQYPENDGVSLTTITSAAIDDGEDITKNFLGLSVTAPAAPSTSGSTEALLSPGPGRKKVKWRRKSDFI